MLGSLSARVWPTSIHPTRTRAPSLSEPWRWGKDIRSSASVNLIGDNFHQLPCLVFHRRFADRGAATSLTLRRSLTPLYLIRSSRHGQVDPGSNTPTMILALDKETPLESHSQVSRPGPVLFIVPPCLPSILGTQESPAMMTTSDLSGVEQFHGIQFNP